MTSTRSPSTVTAPQLRWVLALTSTAYFMVILDTGALFTALPRMQRDLHADLACLQWTVNSYGIAFAAGIITAAALGDRFGRRRVFNLGLALFTLASAGPIGGGVMTEGLDWHWIFWLNVPIGLVATTLATRLLPESHGAPERLDLAGVALVTAGVVVLVWALVRGRMNAVFGNAVDGWVVVDWKTGRKPTGAEAKAAAVQPAAYRLACARLCGIPDDDVHRVRAAFHYVRTNETVEPASLLDAVGLRELIAG
jgi:MFS family permease